MKLYIMKLRNSILTVLLIITLSACEDFLSVIPKGEMTAEQLAGPEYIDGFVNAAYAHMLTQEHTGTYRFTFHGCTRSDDSYKGGSGIDDIVYWQDMELFAPVTASTGLTDVLWWEGYGTIHRCNTALKNLNAVEVEDYPKKAERMGEMRFLRGLTYFKLKLLFKWIPWIDEKLPDDEYNDISNRPDDAENDLGLWQNIYDDFKFAAENLPAEQEEKGRCTRYAAEAFLVRTLLYMAYEQDENYEIININTEKLSEALGYCDDIMSSGKYDLCDDFANNFLPEYDNNTPESIWELQFSIDDGLPQGRLDWGNQVNAPAWEPHFQCCDFHKPSHNLVNAFKTGDNGLPLFDSYNNEEITDNPDYFLDNTFDPRLSHTVAIPGYPWKYDAGLIFDSTARNPNTYGYFNSLKENVSPDCPCVYKPYFVANSMNKREVRYAEVLLWKAEILIQLGRHMEALPIINQIRERAANSVDRLKFADDSYLLDYHVELYEDGVNCNWDQDFAFQALLWENRLEMACEGRRFFDLVRWGIAEEVLNQYFAKEGQRFFYLENGYFTSGRNEYLPIPEGAMDRAGGLYVQNNGY